MVAPSPARVAAKATGCANDGEADDATSAQAVNETIRSISQAVALDLVEPAVETTTFARRLEVSDLRIALAAAEEVDSCLKVAPSRPSLLLAVEAVCESARSTMAGGQTTAQVAGSSEVNSLEAAPNPARVAVPKDCASDTKAGGPISARAASDGKACCLAGVPRLVCRRAIPAAVATFARERMEPDPPFAPVDADDSEDCFQVGAQKLLAAELEEPGNALSSETEGLINARKVAEESMVCFQEVAHRRVAQAKFAPRSMDSGRIDAQAAGDSEADCQKDALSQVLVAVPMVDAGGSASSGLTDAMDASDTVRDLLVVALGLVRLAAAGNAERCVVV